MIAGFHSLNGKMVRYTGIHHMTNTEILLIFEPVLAVVEIDDLNWTRRLDKGSTICIFK